MRRNMATEHFGLREMVHLFSQKSLKNRTELVSMHFVLKVLYEERSRTRHFCVIILHKHIFRFYDFCLRRGDQSQPTTEQFGFSVEKTLIEKLEKIVNEKCKFKPVN